MTSRGIEFEKCAPDTHEQNGLAERMGRVIIEKARAIRLSGKLPHALWQEIIASAVYLYNQTPRQSLEWKSPYEAFHEVTMPVEGVSGPKKPTLNHLKAYALLYYEANSSFFILSILPFSPCFQRQAISVAGLTKINLEYLIFAHRIRPHKEVLLAHIVVHHFIVTMGLHRVPCVTRCDRGCLMFTGLY